MVLNIRHITILSVIAAAIIMMAGSVLAQGNPNGDTRPGWGFGDANHEHTGPPGHSVHP